MNKKAILVLLGFLLFAAAGSWYYLCKIKQVCEPNTDNVSVSIGTSIDQSLAFSWESEEVLKGKGFESLKTQLEQELGADNALEIVGLYDPSEINYSAEVDLGIARAKSIQALFPQSQQTILKSEETTLNSDEAYFQASRLTVVVKHELSSDPTLLDSSTY